MTHQVAVSLPLFHECMQGERCFPLPLDEYIFFWDLEAHIRSGNTVRCDHFNHAVTQSVGRHLTSQSREEHDLLCASRD